MVEYPMPGAAPDLFKGFREELGNIEKKRAEKQEKALRMASMIEMADSSTMFGGDYSIANQWAEHLTKNLDDYASSTEGMIKFQQKAQQLTNFIDGSEAYKKENFGSVKDGPQAGSFQGFAMRKALGENVYGDFEDERDPQSYEMTYMGLNQPIELNWDADDNPVFMSDGKPVPFSQYRRPDSPFMPKLKEGKILMGSTWYASEGPNKSHESSAEAYDYSKAMAKTDPKLARQAARFYQMEEKPNMDVDAIMANPVLMEEAREMWAKDAEKSWVDLNKLKEEKPTPGVFSGNMISTTSGFGGYEINPERPFELTSGELMGNKVRGLAINNNGDFIVTYMSGSEPVEEVIKVGSADHRNIVKHIGPGGVKGLTTIKGMSGQGTQKTSDAPKSSQYTLKERTEERDRLVGALGERFKEETGEDLSNYINTDSESIEGKIDVVSSLNNPDSVEGLYEIFIKEYRNQQEIQGRRKERERQEREVMAPSITGFKAEGGGIIPRVRRFFGA